MVLMRYETGGKSSHVAQRWPPGAEDKRHRAETYSLGKWERIEVKGGCGERVSWREKGDCPCTQVSHPLAPRPSCHLCISNILLH